MNSIKYRKSCLNYHQLCKLEYMALDSIGLLAILDLISNPVASRSFKIDLVSVKIHINLGSYIWGSHLMLWSFPFSPGYKTQINLYTLNSLVNAHERISLLIDLPFRRLRNNEVIIFVFVGMWNTQGKFCSKLLSTSNCLGFVIPTLSRRSVIINTFFS